LPRDSTAAIATAADYADALLTARRAKNILLLLLLFMVLLQVGLFFLARYHVLPVHTETAPEAVAAGTQSNAGDKVDKFHYLIGLTTFLGISLSILLTFVLLLIVNIMLVGRLIGIARLTSAYIWSWLLVLLLFPWQAFLNNATLTATEFRIPGVLYSWEEVQHAALFPNQPFNVAILKWARFVGFPLLAAFIVLVIQVKSNRGLRQAFGDAEVSPTADSLNRGTAT
jgi:hypothetical protein